MCLRSDVGGGTDIIPGALFALPLHDGAAGIFVFQQIALAAFTAFSSVWLVCDGSTE